MSEMALIHKRLRCHRDERSCISPAWSWLPVHPVSSAKINVSMLQLCNR
jgi:hypothetical protein